MDPLPQTLLFMGIIPALVLLFISLKSYEGYYKERVVFLSFICGIILGFIAAVVQSFTLSLAIIYIVLISFFDQLVKTIVLNIGRFQGNKETPVYGLTLGLGFGSSFTPFMIIAVSAISTNNVIVLSLITVGSIGIILFHGATGALIGYGVFIGRLFKYLITAIILQIPFNLTIGLMINYGKLEYLNILVLFVASLIIYSGIIYWYINTKILPRIIEQNEERKRSK